MSKNTKTITDNEFEAQVLQAKGVQLVDFWAEWCGPCRALGPILDQVADDFAGKATVFKLNVDENPATSAKYGIRSIPTVLVFKDGQLATRLVGLSPKDKIAGVINEHL